MNKSGLIKMISHIIVWLLFFTLVLSVSTSMGAATFTQQLRSTDFYVFCVTYLFVFYINGRVLFPTFYLKKRYIVYFAIIVCLGIAVLFVRPFDNLLRNSAGDGLQARPLPLPDKVISPGYNIPNSLARRPLPDPSGNPGFKRQPFIDITSLILFLLVWLASSALQILKQLRNSEQTALLAESDKKTAELAFLKAQINPHFLFNTLNNIYSLAIIQHEQTAVSILKLSNIMRYVTENVTVDFIALEDEVECIVDYVDLQKLRLSQKVYLDFSITGNTQEKIIAPLLLITFIENIFKYGISNHHQSTITIKVFIEEKSITMYCQNKIFNAGYSDERQGVGLSNTRRRLEHLYPGKHTLDINTDKSVYTVQLTLHTE